MALPSISILPSLPFIFSRWKGRGQGKFFANVIGSPVSEPFYSTREAPFSAKLLFEQLLDDIAIDIEERDERAGGDDIFHQHALT